jgi:hypothetical protein
LCFFCPVFPFHSSFYVLLLCYFPIPLLIPLLSDISSETTVSTVNWYLLWNYCVHFKWYLMWNYCVHC